MTSQESGLRLEIDPRSLMTSYGRGSLKGIERMNGCKSRNLSSRFIYGPLNSKIFKVPWWHHRGGYLGGRMQRTDVNRRIRRIRKYFNKPIFLPFPLGGERNRNGHVGRRQIQELGGVRKFTDNPFLFLFLFYPRSKGPQTDDSKPGIGGGQKRHETCQSSGHKKHVRS